MIDVRIVGGNPGRPVNVSTLGELTTGLLNRNQTEFKELAATGTAYNFYAPVAGKQFIINHIFAFGDKQVSPTTNATVEVYEATSISETTVDKVIMTFEIGQNQFQPYTSLNLLVNADRFINAKTDDDDVHMNILGYYIDKLT